MPAATLKELIENGADQKGFILAIGYYVELQHHLMGCFPAIESKTTEMVITTDLKLLKRVCETLTPRRSKFVTQLLYVNPETGTAYSILENLEEATPFQILTQARFDELMKGKQPAFKWAPGLVGDDMSLQEFREALETAASNR
jgi:hypothetical protein